MATLAQFLKGAWSGSSAMTVEHTFAMCDREMTSAEKFQFRDEWPNATRIMVTEERTAAAYRIEHPSGALAYLEVSKLEPTPWPKPAAPDYYECAKCSPFCTHFHVTKPGNTLAEDTKHQAVYAKWRKSVGLDD